MKANMTILIGIQISYQWKVDIQISYQSNRKCNRVIAWEFFWNSFMFKGSLYNFFLVCSWIVCSCTKRLCTYSSKDSYKICFLELWDAKILILSVGKLFSLHLQAQGYAEIIPTPRQIKRPTIFILRHFLNTNT